MKTFSQPELDGMLARERKKHASRIADLEAQLAARTNELELTRTEHGTLKRANEKLQGTHAAIRTKQAERALTDALTSARVLRSATHAAFLEFSQATKLEQNDDGDVVAVEYEGVRYEDLTLAAKAYLDKHDYFKSAFGGGTGTVRPNAGPPAPRPRELTEIDPRELIEAGMRQPSR